MLVFCCRRGFRPLFRDVSIIACGALRVSDKADPIKPPAERTIAVIPVIITGRQGARALP